LPPRPADTASALPANVALGAPQTFSVHDTRIELARSPARPVAGDSAWYSVRLFDAAGLPVSGADVSLYGRLADGTALQTPLPPSGEPGTYRGRVEHTSRGLSDLRLRVARRDGRFEVPLGDRIVGW
ncbi:MAG: hypothetical protein ACREJG_05280, partial [Candidatus Rokuibacteriota bacterium]